MDIYIIREILKIRREMIIYEKIERMTNIICNERNDISREIIKHNNKNIERKYSMLIWNYKIESYRNREDNFMPREIHLNITRNKENKEELQKLQEFIYKKELSIAITKHKMDDFIIYIKIEQEYQKLE
jgi:hypothetical protein